MSTFSLCLLSSKWISLFSYLYWNGKIHLLALTFGGQALYKWGVCGGEPAWVTRLKSWCPKPSNQLAKQKSESYDILCSKFVFLFQAQPNSLQHNRLRHVHHTTNQIVLLTEAQSGILTSISMDAMLILNWCDELVVNSFFLKHSFWSASVGIIGSWKQRLCRVNK